MRYFKTQLCSKTLMLEFDASVIIQKVPSNFIYSFTFFQKPPISPSILNPTFYVVVPESCRLFDEFSGTAGNSVC